MDVLKLVTGGVQKVVTLHVAEGARGKRSTENARDANFLTTWALRMDIVILDSIYISTPRVTTAFSEPILLTMATTMQAASHFAAVPPPLQTQLCLSASGWSVSYDSASLLQSQPSPAVCPPPCLGPVCISPSD